MTKTEIIGSIFDNDISHFFCIGCNDEGEKEEGAMCEGCGSMTCAEHIDMIDRSHIRPKHWRCRECTMIERKGNYIEGTRMQMDYYEMLEMVQVAYLDKKYKMQNLLEKSWPDDTYEKSRYHQHTRGKMIAQLGKEFERIAVILHHLQALGKSKDRQANFTWWFNKGDEEE